MVVGVPVPVPVPVAVLAGGRPGGMGFGVTVMLVHIGLLGTGVAGKLLVHLDKNMVELRLEKRLPKRATVLPAFGHDLVLIIRYLIVDTVRS